MQAKYRRLREDAYEEGRREFNELAADPGFRDFVCLYVAEGHKRSRNTVSLCNSDPAVVKLADRWISRFTRRSMKYSVQYHADQDLQEVIEFWGSELGINPGAIRLQRKSNSSRLKYRTWRCKYGVMDVSTNDTLFRARLQGWVDMIRAAWS
jgi:hypothetical protein